MSRKKQIRFEQIRAFDKVVEPSKEIYNNIKGNWFKHFGNKNSIVLELGCGKGEYTNGLATVKQDQNFVGIDIKGDRLWCGADFSYKNKLSNSAFLQTYVDHLDKFFESGEVSEIWLTFSDPQPNKPKKRLTNIKFLEIYKKVLIDGGKIHLKTDSDELFDYTLEVINDKKLLADSNITIQDIQYTKDLYKSNLLDSHHNIQTTFEKKFLKQRKKIKYLSFSIL